MTAPGTERTHAPRTLSFATADVALRDWVEPWDSSMAAIVASGVSEDAVNLWLRTTRAHQGRLNLLDDLHELRMDWPDLRLDDALGWMLAPAWAHPDDGTQIHRMLLHHYVREWARTGLLHDGWRYLHAGLSPEEATEGLSAGTLTSESLTLLAALRGTPSTPAG